VKLLRLFLLKNAVLLADLGANAVAVGLVAVLIGFILKDDFLAVPAVPLQEVGQWVDTLTGVFTIIVVILYERPIRRLMDALHRNQGLSPKLWLRAQRRLLNEPLFMVVLNLFNWSAAAFAYWWLILRRTITPLQARPLMLNTFLLAVLAAVMVYFAVQAISQRLLIPRVFPQGRIHRIPGVRRISLRARLLVLYLAINLIPLISLQAMAFRVSIAPRPPELLLEQLLDAVMWMVPVIIVLGLAITFLVSGNLSRPLKALTRTLKEVSQGRFEARVRVTSNDEVGYAGEVVNEMARGLQERELIKDAFGKYVTPEIRDEVLSGRIPLDGEVKEVTVLFADLRGFTPLAEASDPKLVVKVLNAYFQEMAEAIQAQGGLVLQFLGDEIYAVFGAPVALADHPARAFRAGLEMRRRLGLVNQRLAANGWPALTHGIGLHTGWVLAANIGASSRMSYLLVGDTVNLASRLQALTKDLGSEMVLSAETYARLAEPDRNLVNLTRLTAIRIKGRRELVELYLVDSGPASGEARPDPG